MKSTTHNAVANLDSHSFLQSQTVAGNNLRKVM